MKVAIVYDRVNKWGGAERVLLALHEIFPDAPLYTSVYDPIGAPWAKIFPKVVTSFLQKLPFARSRHEFFAPLMPLVFESFDFSGFDLVISVTSEAAKGIVTKPGTLHICYCLTPTRYLWSHYDEYFKGETFKGLTKPIVGRLRKWDKIAAMRPDEMIAISTEVKDRIKKYYTKESGIIFPPVKIQKAENRKSKGKYYLIVSRLVKYKRVDLAVKAFNILGLPLVVIGTGHQEKKLKRMAKDNIEFVGKVSEKELFMYYKAAKAFIMPQEEDFGIVAIEAQMFGTPVIAYNKGGAIDTVISEKTGIFFNEKKPESLVNAIKSFEKIKFDYKTLTANANRFSSARFKNEFVDFVKNARMF